VHFGGQMPQRNIRMESEQVINRMNEILQLKRGFKAGTKRTKPLEARLKDYNAKEIIACMEWLWRKWRKWDSRRQYFNPTTVFRASNWERYYEDFEIEKSEESQNVLKTDENERKYFIGQMTFEEYLKCVIGGSQFVRTQYFRLEPTMKRDFEEKVRKSFEKGIEPERVSCVSFFKKIA